jgi:phosphatidate cytidylyltransferase
MLLQRIISAVVLIALLLVAALWLPSGALVGILVVIVVVGVVESSELLRKAGIDHVRNVAVAGAFVLIMGTWLTLLQTGASGVADLELMVVFNYVLILFLISLFRRAGNPYHLAGGGLLLFFYVPFLFNFLVKLLFEWDGNAEGRLLVVYLIGVVKSTDIGAYTVGSAVGRHKMFPRISPGKTWEGCAGGVALAMAVSLGIRAGAGGDFGVVQLGWVDAAVLGLLLPVAGILGDLVESMWKRHAGVKDSGTMIRGMGGVLDVIDSLLLASPVLYIYLRWLSI